MEKIDTYLEMFKTNAINLGELYTKLLHLQSVSDSTFEQTLRKKAGAHTMLLLLTYQQSQSRC
jgi:hypothetical protein